MNPFDKVRAMTQLSLTLSASLILVAVVRAETPRSSPREALRTSVMHAPAGEAFAFHQADKDAPARDDEATALDLKTMQGKWLCEGSEESGKVIDKKVVKGQDQRLSIRAGNFMMTRLYAERIGAYSGKFEIDATTGHFDFVGKGPTGKPVKWVGIYELDRDNLKLCFRYQVEGKVTRPTTFKSDDGQPNVCVFHTYKRERVTVKP